jgi:hypothetical protein
MKRTTLLMIPFIAFGFYGCDDTQNTDGSISANRLIAVPETADETVNTEDIDVAMIAFTEKEYNFGEVESGEKVEHTFSFTNSGSAPLIISNAKASCGCTVPEWPKDPIAPGGEGKIKVVFDSKGKSGVQNKVVTITANTQPSTSEILIKGMVKSPKPTDEQPS